MNKKELDKLREKIKAENPLLTDEQVEDIVAESAKEAGRDESEKEAETLLKEREAFEAEKKALAEETAKLEAETKALAEEKAKLEAEKKALAEEKAKLEAEKKEFAEAALSAERTKNAAQNDGKVVTYVCKMRCTFNGQYYREGDLLTIAGEAPEFFEAVEEGV